VPSPPKPNEQKRRLGNPGKQKLPAVASVIALEPVADRTAPDHLGEHGRDLWDLALAAGEHWIADTDKPILLILCEAFDRRAELQARLQEDGPVLYTDKGYAYAHPCVGMLTSTEAQMTKWFGLLGFSPADRTRLGLAEVKRASKLDALRKQREA
jgi:P27 family predicted phage terminase small subunit